MSDLRPECGDARTDQTSLPKGTILWLVFQAVKKRRSLIHGKLHDNGHSCAMGAFWDDNPQQSVPVSLVDEIAAVNDSVPPTALPSARRRHVYEWLKWRLKSYGRKA